MDMKRILQAMDGVATKPVVGADSMAKFLRVVKEAEINQPAPVAPTPQTPAPVAPAPASTLSPEQLAYNQLRAQLDGADAIRGDAGTNTFTDVSPEITAKTTAMRTKLAQMAAALQAKGIDAAAEYDAPDPAVPVTAPVDLNQKYATEEVGMSRFLSIVNEGKSPHKVALPIQMAMQHFQKKETTPIKKSLGVSKYFHKVEEELAEEQAHKRQLINQYASTIAERVLMKEGKAVKQRLDPKCWTGKHKEGTKVKGGVRVNNCVPNESVNEHESGWDRHGQGPGMQNYVVDEAPLDFDKDVPISSTIHSHKGVNPASIESRIMRARGQLQELAKMSASNDPLAWQHIARLFPELAMNIEQIDHGLKQLGSIRRKGGRNSKNIPQHLDPDVNETVLNPIKPKTATPKAIKPKAKTSTCRAGQTQTGMQIKDGKSVPKCSVTGIKK